MIIEFGHYKGHKKFENFYQTSVLLINYIDWTLDIIKKIHYDNKQ